MENKNQHITATILDDGKIDVTIEATGENHLRLLSGVVTASKQIMESSDLSEDEAKVLILHTVTHGLDKRGEVIHD